MAQKPIVCVFATPKAFALAEQIGKGKPDVHMHAVLIPETPEAMTRELQAALKRKSDMIVLCVGRDDSAVGYHAWNDLHRACALHEGPVLPLVGLVAQSNAEMCELACGLYEQKKSFFCSLNGDTSRHAGAVWEYIDIALASLQAAKQRREAEAQIAEKRRIELQTGPSFGRLIGAGLEERRKADEEKAEKKEIGS